MTFGGPRQGHHLTRTECLLEPHVTIHTVINTDNLQAPSTQVIFLKSLESDTVLHPERDNSQAFGFLCFRK